MTFEEFEKEQAGFIAKPKPTIKPRAWLGSVTAKGKIIIIVASPLVSHKVVLQRHSEGVYEIKGAKFPCDAPLTPEIRDIVNDLLPTVSSHIETVFDLKQGDL